MEIRHSLSTIPEESKSIPTVSSISTKSTYTKRTYASSISSGTKQPFGLNRRPSPLPPLSNATNPRKKRHTSYILKNTSREMAVPHVETHSRTPSLQEKLMVQLRTSKRPLFATVLEEPSQTTVPSILVTGFGLRNVASLQKALQIDDRTRLEELYRSQANASSSSAYSEAFSSEESSDVSCETPSTKRTFVVQTSTDLVVDEASQTQVSYLMGLSQTEEEENENGLKREVRNESKGLDIADFPLSTSKAIRQAQTYLRDHRVFEFFQFIAAHLLSAIPDNPIKFILKLLDKCLLYRSSLRNPPVLYRRKHLGALFNMMDKMGTGYIDLEQYKAATKTLGVCSYDEKPYTTRDGFLARDDFIDTVYESLSHLLDDMIRRHGIRPDPTVTPKSSISQFSSIRSSCSTECAGFGRSDMFLKRSVHE